jgi:hypothetical protein
MVIDLGRFVAVELIELMIQPAACQRQSHSRRSNRTTLTRLSKQLGNGLAQPAVLLIRDEVWRRTIWVPQNN